MTPRNPLDNKVIVDRETLENLILYWVNSDVDSKVLSAAKQALAQDLTGWAAVPKMVTGRMLNAIKESKRLNLEQYVTCSDSMAKQLAYSAMLEASPPLWEVGNDAR